MTTGIVNTGTLFGRAITRGKTPKHSQILSVPLDFTANTIINCSVNVLHGLPNATGIDGIQSIFVDNSNNPSTVAIASDNGPTYTCPSYAQAIFPYFFSGEQLKFQATSPGGVIVNVFFINTREQAQLWTTKIPVAGSVNVSGSQVLTQPAVGAYTDGSGSLATANVSQVLLAANGARQFLLIRNPATAASQNIAAPEPVYVNFGAAAGVNGATSWELLPGEQLPQALMLSTQQINWTAATVGHQLICKYI